MKMKTKTASLKAAVAGVAIISLAACATDNPNRSRNIGAGVGAVAGAVLGNSVSGARGAPWVGAAVGAIAGGAVGNYMDKQRAEMEQQLAKEAERDELHISEMSDGSLRVGVASDISFEFNKAELTPAALQTYGKIASVLQSYDSTVIHVVGHTDTSGSAEYNQSLSVQRAAAVGNYFAQMGVSAARIREEGRGEREPLVRTGDNVKEARNRRVDIVIKPVVEGRESEAWTPPPYLGG